MKRALLDQLLGEVLRLAGDREIVMIGSQAVHAATPVVPVEVTRSRECDILVDESESLAAEIDSQLGPSSDVAATMFVHVDTVSPTFPFLAPGWETRTIPLDATMPKVRCLEIHDLVLSKLAAGRLKDYELVGTLFRLQLAALDTVRARVGEVPDLHMRAILIARLQIVLESARDDD